MKVSVIIPCRNEKNYIKQCIEAIYNNTLSKKENVEVIVVDGLSNDGTLDILQEMQARYPSLKVIENPKQVTPVAFNLGIVHSKGDFIQIIGARQIISGDYLEKAVATIENDSSIWCVGGRVENIYENNDSEIIASAMNTPFGVGGGNFRTMTQSSFVDTAGTPMYPRLVFDKLGLFDEELVRNQDDEFNFRVTRAGGRIFLNADILIQYYVRASFAKLYKQYLQYGYWKVYVNRKHKSVTTLRQLFPAAFVCFIFLGAVVSLFLNWVAALYFSVLLLYFLFAFYFSGKASQKVNHFFPIVSTFLILHFSYGWGYLKGLWDFLVLNRKPSQKQTILSR